MYFFSEEPTTPNGSVPSQPPLSAERTAVESTLPWHRSSERPCMPSSLNLLLPDDNQPLMSPAPSWVDNLGYTETAPEIPSPIMAHEVSTASTAGKDSNVPPPWKHEGEDDEDPTELIDIKHGKDNPAFIGDAESPVVKGDESPPWRSLGSNQGNAKQSPQLKREATLQQHPSTASLRQSEAESHHSDMYRRHSQVLEPILLNPEIELGLDLELDEDQQDGESRVSSWLYANSDNLSSVPDEDDDTATINTYL